MTTADMVLRTDKKRKSHPGRPTLKRTLLRLLQCLIAALLLEATVFNVNFYTHLNNQPVPIAPERITAVGMKRLDDGSFKVTDASIAKFAIMNLDVHIGSAAIRLRRYSNAGDEYLQTSLTFLATDEANALRFTLGSRPSVPGVTQSAYVNVHLAGKSTEFDIRPSAVHKDRFVIEELSLNPRFPFQFLIGRVLLCALSLWLLYILIPRHGYYTVPCRFSSRRQRVIILIVVLFQVAFFTFCAFSNPIFQDPPWYSFGQYHRLAVALSEFDFHLSDIPAVPLTAMENPYDTALRASKSVPALSDEAYYNGYYFCYFGVVPVLMFHLPYYLLTGQAFPTFLGVYITSVFVVLLAFWLVALLVKRFSQEKIPLLAYLILSLLLCGCCTYLVSYPCLYTLPIILGLVFTFLGLCLWLRAAKDDRLRTGHAAAGALCMALVSGCRPQLLLGSFLAIPIFWNSVVRQRQLFSKKTIKQTVAVLLPYVIVGACMMGYNYFRFGSPFDFGATYNITTNDMTRRGFVFARIPLALFLFFFQPPALKPIFPYLGNAYQTNHYLGTTVSEAMFGGVFLTNAVSLGSLFVFKARRLFAEHKALWWTAVACLLLGFGLATFDAQGSGILERYQADFSWMLVLSAILVLLAALKAAFGSALGRGILCSCLSAAFLIGILYFLLIPFVTRSSDDLVYKAPALYYSVYYGVQFWL